MESMEVKINQIKNQRKKKAQFLIVDCLIVSLIFVRWKKKKK